MALEEVARLRGAARKRPQGLRLAPALNGEGSVPRRGLFGEGELSAAESGFSGGKDWFAIAVGNLIESEDGGWRVCPGGERPAAGRERRQARAGGVPRSRGGFA